VPVESTRVTGRKRVFPHVDDIQDWRARQSLRLLWDRVFALEERLQATEATQGDLVEANNAHDDELDQLRVASGEALALAQTVAAAAGAGGAGGGGGGGEGGGGGPSTMPNYFSIVTAALAGFDPIVPVAEAAAGAAQLTRVAAWDIYQVDPNIRLLEKTSGTQVNGRSIDVIVQATDGSYTDMASWHDNEDGTVTILAMWQPNGPSGPRDPSREIVPTAAIAAEAGPMAPA
jgi:hypothetical protein